MLGFTLHLQATTGPGLPVQDPAPRSPLLGRAGPWPTHLKWENGPGCSGFVEGRTALVSQALKHVVREFAPILTLFV